MKIKMTALLLFSALLISLNTSAQKIGHVNSQDILIAMPEYKKASDSLQRIQMQKQRNLQTMALRLDNEKKSYLSKQDSYDLDMQRYESNRIKQLEQNLMSYRQQAARDLDSLQMVFLEDIMDKIEVAVKKVAEEKNYEYIFNYSPDMQLMLYYKKENDITPLVKKELKLP